MAQEKKLDEKVKAYLQAQSAWFIKYWGGGGFTKSGIPDILACIDGDFVAIEDKADNGKPTMLQLVNLKKIRNAGGYGVLLYAKDFEQFKEFVERRSRGHPWYVQNIELQKKWKQKLEREV